VTRPNLGLGGKLEELLVKGAKDPARPVGLVDCKVRARDVVHEQRVAGQHRPGLIAAIAVDERERRVLGPVARRMDGADDQRAELELPAVVEGLVRASARYSSISKRGSITAATPAS
jgi:hypothetical protein